MPPGSTTVEISLVAEDDGTKLTFVHRELPTEASRDSHASGWDNYLGTEDADAGACAASWVPATAPAGWPGPPSVRFFCSSWFPPLGASTARNGRPVRPFRSREAHASHANPVGMITGLFEGEFSAVNLLPLWTCTSVAASPEPVVARPPVLVPGHQGGAVPVSPWFAPRGSTARRRPALRPGRGGYAGFRGLGGCGTGWRGTTG